MKPSPTPHDEGLGLDYRCCHPTHAMRTKCRCGAVIELRGAFGNTSVKCDCGRRHRKSSGPRGSFAEATMVTKKGALSTGKRPGGKAGCPGIGGEDE